jgi:hypothetical protein
MAALGSDRKLSRRCTSYMVPLAMHPSRRDSATSRATLEGIPKVTPRLPELPCRRLPTLPTSPNSSPHPRAREAEFPRTPPEMATALALALAAAVLAVASLPTGAVWLEVPQSGTKCVSEEIQSNVVVLADYAIMFDSHPDSHPTIGVKVS